VDLRIEELTKRFDEHIAVNNISLEVKEGEVLGFLGGNGAGKTTTFRMILGLLTPSSGRVTLNGKPLDYSTVDKIGYLPEERGLYPKMTVKEQISFFGRLKNMKRKELNQEMMYWLERFNLLENKNKAVGDLSKGNQQKVQLITSIIHKPKLLILDEPFSGLDPINVEMLKEAVMDLKKQGTSILFSSHRMEHVEELCRSVCIMKKGKPVVQGEIQKIKSDFNKKKVYIRGEKNQYQDFNFLKQIKGVENVTAQENGLVLNISDENAAKLIFTEVVKNWGYVKHFSIEEATLNEIFIAKVGESYE
jgi:ABC-2 type transport system ATP-binding protein